MTNVNLVMNDWVVSHTSVPIDLGKRGENNAMSINIVIGEKLDKNEKYYLDIMDRVEGETVEPRTQEMILNEYDHDGIITYVLEMQPQAEWLGNNGVKFVQVRCEYTENEKDVIIKSNVFRGVVDLGLFMPSNRI